MAKVDYEIEKYFIEMLGANSSSEEKELRARLLLFSKDFKGIAAEIKFYPLIQLWTKQDFMAKASEKKPLLAGHMAFEMFDDVIDILRNEKPIYVVWLEDSQRVSLRTHLEPVGEGEG